MNTILKNRVNEFLRCSGMSQSQFAKNVDLWSVTISQWLGDKRIISQKAERSRLLAAQKNRRTKARRFFGGDTRI